MILLRSYVEGDLPALGALDKACFRPGIAYSEEELTWFVHHPASITLVAEEDGRLAGFAVAECTRLRGRNVGHMITIDVSPELRRRSVGRLLMRGMEEALASRGMRICRLEVAVDDPGAIEFYAQLGYEAVGQIRRYYMGSLDALVMERELIQQL